MAKCIDRPTAPTQGGRMTKRELCSLLGWSRPTLDLRLETDAVFPIVQRGSRGVPWEFDKDAVLAYLGGAPSADVGECNTDPTSETPRRKPVAHEGELTSRQRRDAVQAEILEDKLRRDRGELVVAQQMRQVLTTMLAHLGKGLDRLPDQLVKKLGLPESSADVMRIVIDDLRRNMADDMRALL